MYPSDCLAYNNVVLQINPDTHVAYSITVSQMAHITSWADSIIMLQIIYNPFEAHTITVFQMASSTCVAYIIAV